MKTIKEQLERSLANINSSILWLKNSIYGPSEEQPPDAPVYALMPRMDKVEQAQVGMIAKRDFKSSYSWSANDYMGIDMNGVYAVTSNNNIQDFPSGVSKGGILTVKFGTDDRGIQEYVPRSTSDLYIRSYWDGSWTEWVKK